MYSQSFIFLTAVGGNTNLCSYRLNGQDAGPSSPKCCGFKSP